jgi:hypothetical protein
VLTDAAEKLFALHVTSRPPASRSRCSRWSRRRRPHNAASRGPWSRTPRSRPVRSIDRRRRYAEVLALTPEKEAGRNELVERLAASIYKQGEQARAAGQTA